MLRAVIFDLHGTLLDDEALRVGILRDLAQDEGLALAPSAFADLAGLDDASALRRIFSRANEPLAPDALRRLVAEKHARMTRAIGDAPPFHPGAVELVEAASRRWPVAIVAGSLRAEAAERLKAAGIYRRITALVTLDEHAIPSEAAYTTCLERIDAVLARYRLQAAPPRRVLVFEDTEAGAVAARAARMKVVAVGHTHARDRLEFADAFFERIGDVDLVALEKELF